MAIEGNNEQVSQKRVEASDDMISPCIKQLIGGKSEIAQSVSVIICTLNRCGRLEHSLESLVLQSYPLELTEVIVVDNGSTDRTEDVVTSFKDRLPSLRYLVERREGLSYARNRGLAEAAGDIVAYLDDDAIAGTAWVERMLEVWRREPDVCGAGGPITVRWPACKPSWMAASLEGYFGRCDYGAVPRRLTYPECPFGSNMAFRRDILMEMGGFDSRLGLGKGKMMAAEETDLFLRLDRRGAKVFYVPNATVMHWPPEERVTRRWSLIRALCHGASNSLLQYLNGDRRRGIWARKLVTATVRTAVSAVSTVVAVVTGRDATVIMSRSAMTSYWAGFARGALRNALGHSATNRSDFGTLTR